MLKDLFDVTKKEKIFCLPLCRLNGLVSKPDVTDRLRQAAASCGRNFRKKILSLYQSFMQI